MHIRTFLSILLGLLVVVYVAFFTQRNIERLVEPFEVASGWSVPLYAVLLGVFLLGLLPPALVLLVRTLKRDLSLRRERRKTREAESLEYRFRRAADYHVDGQWNKAAVELEVLLTERPEDFATLLRYGEVLRHQGKTREALEVHRRGTALYPHSVALLYQLAEDYDALGDEQVAHEIRNRILRDFPGQGLQVMRRRRDLAMASGQWDEAVRWHEKVEALLTETGDTGGLELESGVAQGLVYQGGVALLEKDRPEEAAAIFRRLLGEEPLFVPAGIMLGEAQLLQGLDEEALAEWRAGFERTKSPVFLKRIEDFFIENEEPARAIETLRSIIAATDNDLVPRFFLGRLYYRLEMHDEALKVLEVLDERLDPSPTFHYLLGRIRQRRDDQRGAMTRYLVCLQRLGVSNAYYVCRRCHAHYSDWQDRCEVCGRWNSVDLDIEVEQLTAEELGVPERPEWGGYEPATDDTEPAVTASSPAGTGKPKE